MRTSPASIALMSAVIDAVRPRRNLPQRLTCSFAGLPAPSAKTLNTANVAAGTVIRFGDRRLGPRHKPPLPPWLITALCSNTAALTGSS
jgi:hypothetical protein